MLRKATVLGKYLVTDVTLVRWRIASRQHLHLWLGQLFGLWLDVQLAEHRQSSPPSAWTYKSGDVLFTPAIRVLERVAEDVGTAILPGHVGAQPRTSHSVTT